MGNLIRSGRGKRRKKELSPALSLLVELSFALGKTLDELRVMSEADMVIYAKHIADNGTPAGRIEYLLAQASATMWATQGAQNLQLYDFMPPCASKAKRDAAAQDQAMADFFA